MYNESTKKTPSERKFNAWIFAQNPYQLCTPLRSFILGSILFILFLGALALPLNERNIQNYFISIHLKDDYLRFRQIIIRLWHMKNGIL